MGMEVGEGSVEEVIANGKPAVFINGMWNGEGEWESDSGAKRLMWYQDNWRYNIQTFNQEITLEELLKIAESIE